MQRRSTTLATVLVVTANLVLAGLILMLAPQAGVSAQDEPVHWTYEGEEGPEHWGAIQEDYALCGAGKTQSPINISGAYNTDIVDISFDYSESALNILNNGHTVQANYDAGSSITYNGVTYDLLQVHFHHPSEHTIEDVATPLEVHFVHRDADGNLAVVGVMLTEGETDNAAFAAVFDNLPAEESEVETLEATISAADMLPETATYFTYSGSLTTPPCSEGVRWLVMQEPVALGGAQIEAFSAIFELNARPVQSVNARDILLDTASE